MERYFLVKVFELCKKFYDVTDCLKSLTMSQDYEDTRLKIQTAERLRKSSDTVY